MVVVLILEEAVVAVVAAAVEELVAIILSRHNLVFVSQCWSRPYWNLPGCGLPPEPGSRREWC